MIEDVALQILISIAWIAMWVGVAIAGRGLAELIDPR